jgi:uncharacterized protein with PIN domain
MDMNQMVQAANSKLSKNITFRCYAELNDFLSQEQRQKQFVHSLKTPVTLGEALESLRIPWSEVDLVLVNGEPETLDARLRENDFVSVYPACRKVYWQGSHFKRMESFIRDLT